jgi:ubiquinone/menaquinone biosynthesis C-methylase UbiE
MRLTQVFDHIAESYDRWYDTPEGQAIFHAEWKCIGSLCGHPDGQWLEVGVGTGRFASSLSIDIGVDPSFSMLRVAARRGILTCAGYAENIPFRGNSFDGVLLALTLCFIADSNKALKECRRVLKPRGKLLLGVILADSPWGRAYERKKARGHPIYGSAIFRGMAEISTSVKNIGFSMERTASTLFWNPDEPPEIEPRVEIGTYLQAGFVSLLCVKK